MNVGQYPSVSSLDFMFHELVTDVMFVGGVMSTSNDGFRHPRYSMLSTRHRYRIQNLPMLNVEWGKWGSDTVLIVRVLVYSQKQRIKIFET